MSLFIYSNDIQMAIKKLKSLGNGFSVIPLGGERFLVQSVPGELTMDHTTVIQLAEVTLPTYKKIFEFFILIHVYK